MPNIGPLEIAIVLAIVLIIFGPKRLPGLGKQLKDVNIDDNQLARVEAMVTSMTVKERRNPKLLQNPSRARRIARGSGATQQDVQKLVKQFGEMQKMMKQMGKGGGMPKIPGLPGRR